MTLKKAAQNETLLKFSATLAACIPQVFATVAAWNRFQHEEIAESIRNPFWLVNHSIYDGVSSNIGWYGLMAIYYKIFGFDLAGAKFVRLLLLAASLYCFLDILRKYLSWRAVWVPFLLIALSPSALYFTTLQTSFGIDLQLCLISFWVVMTLPAKNTKTALFLYAGLGALLAWACMCYGTFLFFIPTFGLILLSRYRNSHRNIQGLILCVISLISVPILSSLYLDHPWSLFNDPVAHAGLFRGGGGSLQFEWDVFSSGITQTITDLFNDGSSYYFPLKAVEFDGLLGVLSFLMVLFSTVLAFHAQPKLRMPILFAFIAIGLALVVPSLSAQYPGLRRNTPAIAGFYALAVIIWIHSFHIKKPRSGKWPWKRVLAQSACSFLLLHHIIGFPSLYRQLALEGKTLREPWLNISSTPEAALNAWKSLVRDKTPISCNLLHLPATDCKFSEFFATLAGDLIWNQKTKPEIFFIDSVSNKKLLLDTKLWETYYFPH